MYNYVCHLDRPDQILNRPHQMLMLHYENSIHILFDLNMKGLKTTPARVVRDVLNQAFDLSLSLEECMDAGRQILPIVSET